MSWWQILVLVGLIAQAILTIPLLACVLYFGSPLGRWRWLVLGLHEDAQLESTRCHDALQNLAQRRDTEEEVMRGEAQGVYLHSIPVSELEMYPGIGPATVAKLRKYGFATLADFESTRKKLPSLGQKRTTDLQKAIRDLKKQSLSRFQASGTNHAADLSDRLLALAVKLTEEERKLWTRAQAADAVVVQLAPAVAHAQTLGFVDVVLRRTNNVPADVYNAPLPDLWTILDQAEARVDVTRPAIEAVQTVPVASREAQLAELDIAATTEPSADLIRRQYQLLHDRYNPDRLEPFGPDFVALARSKREAVRAAALALLEPFGEQLDLAPPPPPRGLRDNPELDALFGA